MVTGPDPGKTDARRQQLPWLSIITQDYVTPP